MEPKVYVNGYFPNESINTIVPFDKTVQIYFDNRQTCLTLDWKIIDRLNAIRNAEIKKGNKNITQCDCSSIVEIVAKCNDMCFIKYKNMSDDGYVPSGIGLGNDGDYIRLKYCPKCGKIQDDFSGVQDILEEYFESK